MRGWNALIPAAAGAAVIGVAAACGVARSPAAGPAGTNAAASASSPATEPTAPKGPQYALTGVSCASATACTAVGEEVYAVDDVGPAVLRWDGKTWSVQHAPNPPAYGGSELAAVSCPGPDDCIAVGARGGPGGTQNTLAEHWNGKTWRVQPTPMSHAEATQLHATTELNGVSCSSPSACTAVGDRLVTRPNPKGVTVAMRWNGKTWAAQSTPNTPTAETGLVSVSCPAAVACTAIGYQQPTPASGLSALLAAQWNGRRWKLQPVPAPAGGPGRVRSVACASARDCVAVGINDAAGTGDHAEAGAGLQQPVSVVWNGSTWQLAPVPYLRGTHHAAWLYGVDCSAATACTAVGSYDTGGDEGGPAMAERWNGISWTRQDAATPPGDTANLTAVSCPSSRFCIAVGDARIGKRLAERWDGSTWALTPIP
jgi:ferredoxin